MTTSTAQRIVPNLWLPGNGAQAAKFYLDVFGQDSRLVASQHYPTDGLPEFQQHLAGELLVGELSLRGYRMTILNADDTFTPTPALSFMLNFDPLRYDAPEQASQDLDECWAHLADGGKVLMPLDTYDFSQRYGWVQDRFGFTWQLILTDSAGAPRPFIAPVFMFGGPHQGQATKAADYWVDHFANAQLATRVHYPQDTGPATIASVMFSDFQLAGQWFVAMDAGVDHDFTFTPAVSLSVQCRDQAEIDAHWAALSAVPEAEQCGWCQDRFGVSWQIVPEDITQLLQRDGAYEAMLGMRKLVIADF